MTNLDKLIEILCVERGKCLPETLTEKDKSHYFHALCNEREPRPVSPEFLILQEEFLLAKTIERGVVDVRTFDYSDNITLWHAT